MLHAFTKLSLVCERHSTVTLGVGVIGTESDSLRVVSDRLLRLLMPSEGVAPITWASAKSGLIASARWSCSMAAATSPVYDNTAPRSFSAW